MKRFILTASIIMLAALPTQRASAWNPFGHTNSPAAEFVVKYMKEHNAGQKEKWICDGQVFGELIEAPHSVADQSRLNAHLASLGYLQRITTPSRPGFMSWSYIPTEKFSEIATKEDKCFFRQLSAWKTVEVVRDDQIERQKWSPRTWVISVTYDIKGRSTYSRLFDQANYANQKVSDHGMGRYVVEENPDTKEFTLTGIYDIGDGETNRWFTFAVPQYERKIAEERAKYAR